MKTIFVDLMCSQPVAGTKFHGGGEYAKTIFQALSEYHNKKIQLNTFYNPDLFIDDWILELIQKYNIDVYRVHNYREISSLQAFQNADTFFAGLLTGVTIIQFPKQMQVIGTYHGFRSLESPTDRYAYLYEKNWKGVWKETVKYYTRKSYFAFKLRQMKASLDPCTKLIADSEHSKYAMRIFFGDTHKPIYVFYPPLKYVSRLEECHTAINKKTILMLGGNRWVKNCYRGTKALDNLFSNHQLEGYTVEVIGGIPDKIAKKLRNIDRFISKEYLSPLDLEQRYQMCDIFFYPTLNEGFGSPPLEAMKYGKTCVISAVTSLPEIYLDTVYYCNPYDLNEMQSRLLQASEEKIPIERIMTGYQRIVQRQKTDLEKLCCLIMQ